MSASEEESLEPRRFDVDQQEVFRVVTRKVETEREARQLRREIARNTHIDQHALLIQPGYMEVDRGP